MKKILFIAFLIPVLIAVKVKAQDMDGAWKYIKWYAYEDSVYHYVDVDDDFDTQYSTQNAYVSEIPSQITVTEKGASVVNVPLDLSDLSTVLKPNLALTYNSMSTETMFGNEWGLSGLSKIDRVSKSVYYDGVTRRPDKNAAIDGTEAFTLNGTRLIVLQNNFPNSVSYQTETGYIKVKAHIAQRQDTANVNNSRYEYAYFEVFYPNGKTAIFGFEQIDNSKSQMEFPITRMVDISGNAIRYDYIYSYDEYRISRINFGMNMEGSVNFFYKADEIVFQKRENLGVTYHVFISHDVSQGYVIDIRNEIPPLYMTKSTNCLLSHIEIKYNEEKMRSYVLKHHSNGNNIFISSIQLLKKKADSGNIYSVVSDNGNPGNVVLQNDTAEFVMPLRFHYAKNKTKSYRTTVDSLSCEYTNLKSKTGTLGIRQTNGVIIYPKVNSFVGETCLETENIMIKPDLSNPETLLLPVGEGFLDVLCLDIDDAVPGDEIIKINNIVSNITDEFGFTTPLADVLNFVVYTIDETNQLRYLYTRTYATQFDHSGSPCYKEFFCGDFNGDGSNEILAVSALRTTYSNRNQIPFGEMYDLKNGTTLYQNTMFDNVYVPDNTPGADPNQPIGAVFEFKTTLIAGDFNGDGKTDFFYKPKAGTLSAFIEFDFNNARMKKIGNNFIVPSKAFNIYSPDAVRFCAADLNGDKKTDLYVSGYDIYFSDGLKLTAQQMGCIEENFSFFSTKDVDDDGQNDLTFIKSSEVNTYFMDKDKIVGLETDTINIAPNYILATTDYLNTEDRGDGLIFVNKDSIMQILFDIDVAKSALLTKVKSGTGIITAFDYGRQVDETPYPLSFPYQKSNNITKVNRMYTRLGDDNVNVKKYNYQNGITHKQGLDFCGFEKVTVSDSISGMSVVQTFDPLRFGIPLSIESAVSKTTNTFNIEVQPNKILKTELATQLVSDKLRNTSVTTQVSSYDGFGNPLNTKTDYGQGLETSTTNTYSYTDNATTYRVLPLTQTTTNKRSGVSSNSKTTYSYNTKGLPTYKTQYVNGLFVAQENYIYDLKNQLTEQRTKRYGSAYLTTKYEYDDYGRQTKVTDPLNLSVSYSYNTTNGRLDKTTDHKGNQTAFSYDFFGQLIKETRPDGTVSETSRAWASDVEGAIYCITNKSTGQPTVRTWFDIFGRELCSAQKRFDGSELKTNKQYDARGRLISESLPYKNTPSEWNSYNYDNYNRPVSIQYASGKEDTWAYNENSVTTVTDQVSTTRHYNSKGELVSVDNQGSTISYTYRPDGQVSAINTDGVTTAFGYDNYGRQTSIDDPSAGLETMEYDPVSGQVKKITDANNKAISLMYDNYGRLSSKSSPEFATTYNYQNGLLVAEQTNNSTATEYQYDNLERVIAIKETAPDSKWIKKEIGYEKGKITTINHSFSSGSEAVKEFYAYKNGYLYKNGIETGPYIPPTMDPKIGEFTTFSSRITVPTSGIGVMITDEVIGEDLHTIYNNRLTVWTLTAENDMGLPTRSTTGPLTRTYAYDAYGYPTARGVQGSGNNTLFSQSYEFDAPTGNLNLRADLVSNRTEHFSYDGHNRLTAINTTLQNQTLPRRGITYEPNGNITGIDGVGTFGYNIDGKPYQISDAQPEPAAMPRFADRQDISYTSFKRPDSIKQAGYIAAFTYNARNERVKMTIQKPDSSLSVKYYLGGNYESGTAGEMLYLGGDAYTAPAVYKKEGNNWNIYYLCRDYQGSIVAITNSTGSKVAEYNYSAWGQRTVVTGGLAGFERGYTGHEHLDAFGLINMNARLYDPMLGRFLSPDPYIQDPTNSQNFNRYSYCLNNPLKYTDVTGEKIHKYKWNELIRAYQDQYGNYMSESDQFWYENGLGDFVYSGGSGWDIDGGIYMPGSIYFNSATNQIRYLQPNSGNNATAWLRTRNLNQYNFERKNDLLNKIGMVSDGFSEFATKTLESSKATFKIMQSTSDANGLRLNYTKEIAKVTKYGKYVKGAGWAGTTVIGVIQIGVALNQDGGMGYNTGKTATGIATGIGAGALGAFVFGGLGTLICPGPGTAVGAMVGSMVFGYLGSEGGEAIYDGLVK